MKGRVLIVHAAYVLTLDAGCIFHWFQSPLETLHLSPKRKKKRVPKLNLKVRVRERVATITVLAIIGWCPGAWGPLGCPPVLLITVLWLASMQLYYKRTRMLVG